MIKPEPLKAPVFSTVINGDANTPFTFKSPFEIVVLIVGTEFMIVTFPEPDLVRVPLPDINPVNVPSKFWSKVTKALLRIFPCKESVVPVRPPAVTIVPPV